MEPAPPQHAAGATLSAADRSLQLHAARAPASAAMNFSGPLLKEAQSLKAVAVVSEHARHAFLQGGVYGREAPTRLVAQRTDWSGEYRARDEAGCARSYARDALRAEFITANQKRSGFNPITGAEENAAKDNYKPRGRVCVAC